MLRPPLPALPPVLQVDDGPEWRGGQQQVLYLHQGLVAAGHDSTVVCRPRSPLHDRLRDEQLPHATLRLQGGYDLVSAWRLGRRAHGVGAIVHTHTSHAHDLGLWAARLGARFPLVVSRRVDFPVGRGWLGRRKYLDPRVSLYLAISSGVETALREGGVPANRIRRVPSGIDLGRFDGVRPATGWRAQLGLEPDEILVGSVAALAPHKDQRTLLRAFAELRRVGGRAQLVILGKGSQRPALERLRAELRLERVVHLPGFCADVLARLAVLDVFVLSSYLEGLGTSILDAMAMGLPVVATRTGGIPDAVLAEETGLLVPPRDAEALAGALLRLTGDAALRRSFGEAGRRHVRSFDVRNTVEQTLAAYREAVSPAVAPVQQQVAS